MNLDFDWLKQEHGGRRGPGEVIGMIYWLLLSSYADMGCTHTHMKEEEGEGGREREMRSMLQVRFMECRFTF